MIPVVVTVGPLTASAANNIATSQSAAGAAALTINGSLATSGIATLDTARRVLITSAADDSAVTFRVTGTNHTGNKIQETVTGSNGGTVATASDFKTVTEVRTSAATAGNVTVGTNGVASSPWFITNYHAATPSMSIGVVVSGTVSYTIEYTYDNPNDNQNKLGSQGDPGNYPSIPTSFSHATLVTQTATADGVISNPIFAWRLTLNSQTNPGYATATAIAAGISG